MAQTYTRQSSFSDGDSITAALFNNEYNQLVNAFTYSSSDASATGHRHDGSAGQGGNIFKIGDLDFLNKVEIDSTNNRVGFYVEVSSAAVEQLRIQDGAIVPVTDSDIDLGTTSLRFKDTFTDSITTTGNVDVGGNLTVTGTTTFNGGTLTLGDAADDNVVFGADVNSNIIPNTDNAYDLGSSSQEWKDLYVDGIAYLDGINFNGTAITSTAAELNILDGVTSTAAELNILDGVTSTTAELNILDGVTSSTAELNILDGVTATATEINLLDGVTSTTAELNILDGVTSTATELNLLDGVTATTTELNYVDVATAGTVEASKAIVVDSNKDFTGARNITITGELDAATLDVSGDVDIDGTLEADAITINGTTLAETISDTVGAMVTSNTETGITVTYDDSDNTLDFVIGTLNQDTTGNAATATALETARTIHGVSFDGTANIDLSEVIQDTVGAMVSSNTESGITVAYEDSDGTLDFTVGTLNQDTTGNAATATALETARTIHGVSFDGTGNIDLTEVIQDTVGAMVSSNTETGITVTYEDSDGTLDFAVSGSAPAADDITTGDAAVTIGTSSGDITLDTPGDIILDADGGDLKFKDGGSSIMEIKNESGSVDFLLNTTDDDYNFKGSDGGSTITALTLDMSEAGAATFNSTVTANAGVVVDNITIDGTEIDLSSGDLSIDVAGNIQIDADDAGEIRLLDGGTQYAAIKKDGNNALFQSIIADGDFIIQGIDGSSFVSALTLDMSEAGNASFNGTVTANAGLIADNITIDGTEIDLSSGDLTIDVAGDIILDADGADIYFKDAGTEFLRFQQDGGNCNIRQDTSDKDILFLGNDGGSSIVALTLDMSEAGAATFNNNVTAFSDERLKDNIETLEDGLDKVEQLRGVTYTRDDREEIGVIAQEVEKILPEIVLTADDEMGTKSVDYSRITAVLIEAVKELSAKVKELENK